MEQPVTESSTAASENIPKVSERNSDDEANSGSTPSTTKEKIVVEAETENGVERTKPELVNFCVVHDKIKYNVTFDVNKTVKDLKDHLEPIIKVPQSVQKVMIKGLAKEYYVLKDLDVKEGTKVMVVGSKMDDIITANTVPTIQELEEYKQSTKEPFCKQKMHKKVLDKGKPEDVMIGIKNVKDPLPSFPLSGMLNKSGGKVRLTFKLELDQLWIGTKERTEKVTMTSIKSIVNEPIEGHEEYHIMGFQLGTTEASRYWVYWVPAQYVDAIKNTVLGTWAL